MLGSMERTRRKNTGRALASLGLRQTASADFVPADYGRGAATRTSLRSSHSGYARFRICPLHLTLNIGQVTINLFPLLASNDLSFTAALTGDNSQLLLLLGRLIPCLSLIALFISSTAFTESISLEKYPEGYAAYQKRVAEFIPILTPVWGLLLNLTGGQKEKERVEALVWGSAVKDKDA